MDTQTGNIRYLKENEIPSENEISISPEMMTEKQRATLQVSKFDSVSSLGKLYGRNRKERRANAKKSRRG